MHTAIIKIVAIVTLVAASGCDLVQKKDIADMATKAELATELSDVVREGDMPDLTVYVRTSDLEAAYAKKSELTKLATAADLEALRQQLAATTTTATAALALAQSNEGAISALHEEILSAQADLRGLREETNAQWIYLKRHRIAGERDEGNLALVRERVETNERNIDHLANPDQGKVAWQPMKRADARMRRKIACEQARCAAK